MTGSAGPGCAASGETGLPDQDDSFQHEQNLKPDEINKKVQFGKTHVKSQNIDKPTYTVSI